MEGWRKDLCRSFGYPGSAGYPHAHFQWAQLQVWGLQLKPSQHHITIVCSVVHLFISGYKCIIFQPWTHHFSVTQHHTTVSADSLPISPVHFYANSHVVGKANPRLGPCPNEQKAWVGVSTISRFWFVALLKRLCILDTSKLCSLFSNLHPRANAPVVQWGLGDTLLTLWGPPYNLW